VVFRAGRRAGRHHAREDAEGSLADTATLPADPAPVADDGPVAADSGPVAADSGPVAADSGPVAADPVTVPAAGGPPVSGTRPGWAGWVSRPPAWAALIIAFVVWAGLTITPASGASSDIPLSFLRAAWIQVPASLTGQDIAGTPAVGALFTMSGGKLGSHFCTASVIDSPLGDLVITAAHCVSGAIADVAFVPGYDAGVAPYGVWMVTKVYVDASWSASSDPDDDVAFLRVSQASSTVPIEDVTGAEQLGTGDPAREFVEVIGYPDATNQAIACRNWTKEPMADQLEFDCGGYTNGTSGGPFLASVNPQTGRGTVIGVIGGYEQGGLTPQVSYSAMFGANVTALYQVAVAGG
jgi:V8-like Glu-specific endopeptidase